MKDFVSMQIRPYTSTYIKVVQEKRKNTKYNISATENLQLKKCKGSNKVDEKISNSSFVYERSRQSLIIVGNKLLWKLARRV